MSDVDFRPTLNRLYKTWELCHMAVKDKKAQNINCNRIKRKNIYCGIPQPLSYTLDKTVSR